jgi:hypothetical protein
MPVIYPIDSARLDEAEINRRIRAGGLERSHAVGELLATAIVAVTRAIGRLARTLRARITGRERHV